MPTPPEPIHSPAEGEENIPELDNFKLVWDHKGKLRSRMFATEGAAIAAGRKLKSPWLINELAWHDGKEYAWEYTPHGAGWAFKLGYWLYRYRWVILGVIGVGLAVFLAPIVWKWLKEQIDGKPDAVVSIPEPDFTPMADIPAPAPAPAAAPMPSAPDISSMAPSDVPPLPVGQSFNQ